VNTDNYNYLSRTRKNRMSTIYRCELCGKIFPRKSNFILHSKRKTPCVPAPAHSGAGINERILDEDEDTEEKYEIVDEERMISPEINQSFTFIDLFCGIGGFHQVFHKLGGTCVLACDTDKECRKTYEENYGIKPFTDVYELNETNLPEFDILCGGFPCQPFSNAGKKQSRADSRGQLFDEIMRIANIKHPKMMFLENVKHILKISNGEVMKYILTSLDKNGYFVLMNILSPHQLGIPQQRERVIFSCIRKDIYNKNPVKPLLKIPKIIKMKNIFQEDEEIDRKYLVEEPMISVLKAWDEMISVFCTGERLSPTILCSEFQKIYTPEEFKGLPIWKQDYIKKNRPLYVKYQEEWDRWYDKYKDLLTKREIYCKLEWQTGPKEENDSIFNHFIQFRQSGIRVKKSKYFPTLVAMVQTPIYGKKMRYITPRECARLQSFPDSFKLHSNDKVAYKQLGNAVNVDVIFTVASQILSFFSLESCDYL
jgi:DNA (cytosine-5)-methyltransferase 1